MLGRVIAIFLGLCGLMFSIYLAFTGWMEVEEAQASNHWPSVMATIIDSQMTQEKVCSKGSRCHLI